jgi:hypothetical protein
MKTQLSKPARGYARYTDEYKEQALQLWRASGQVGESWIDSVFMRSVRRRLPKRDVLGSDPGFPSLRFS